MKMSFIFITDIQTSFFKIRINPYVIPPIVNIASVRNKMQGIHSNVKL